MSAMGGTVVGDHLTHFGQADRVTFTISPDAPVSDLVTLAISDGSDGSANVIVVPRRAFDAAVSRYGAVS